MPSRNWTRFGMQLLLSFFYFAARRFLSVFRLFLTTGLISVRLKLCILWMLGDLLFHWLAAFWVDISLLEGKGYVELAVFREFGNTLREVFDNGTWQIYKKITKRNKRKCWHPFGDWCFVINTAQFFWINDRISYPMFSLEHRPVIWSWWLLPPLENKSQART